MREFRVPLDISSNATDNETRATITLHNPYIDFTNENNVSMSRCVNSAKQILKAFYSLSQESIDVTKLHPFVTVRCLLF
jgi:hypothetical protein